MVRFRACQRRCALDDVETVHFLAIVGDAAAGREILLVPHAARSVRHEIGVQRDDDVRLVEVIDRVLAVRQRALHPSRVPLVPRRLRVVACNCRDDFCRRGRRDRPGQEAEASPLTTLLGGQRRLRGRQEVAPRPHFTAKRDGLRAIGIVQIENRGLREAVGAAKARRVLGIAFDLGRPPHVALDEHRVRVTAVSDRARKEERTPGNDVFRLPDVGNDLFFRLTGAGADASQRQRRAHQLQEIASPLGIVPLRRLLRELSVQVVAEFRRIGQLAEAAPVQAALGAGKTGAYGRKIHCVATAENLPVTGRATR